MLLAVPPRSPTDCKIADGGRSQRFTQNRFKLAGFGSLAQTRPIAACQLHQQNMYI